MTTFPKKLFLPLIIKRGKKIEKKQFSKLPIVIGACPRSGTTILLSVLGAHPNLFAIPNQTYAFDRWEEYGENGKQRFRPTRLDRLYREFLFAKIPQTARRWCEKTPKHIRSFDKILDYFKNDVKLINVVRDGRDVVTSKHPKHTPDQYWVSIRRWVSDVQLGIELSDHPSVLTVKYENLVNDFENEIKKVCDFIEEPVTDSLYSFTTHTNIVKSKHLAAPVEKLYARSIAKWEKPEHAERLEEFMADAEAVALLTKLGYI